MIAKIVKGESFSGVLKYILDPAKQTELINSEGVRTKNRDSIISSFEAQAQLNPRVIKNVYHISLNFSARDKEIITNELMAQIASEYMTQMKLVDTQFIIGRHHDKEHPHIHICCNRVNNYGKTISDKNDRFRSEAICKELTLKHGLYYAQGKENVKEHRLKEPDKTKYEIYNVLKSSVPKSNDWKELVHYLNSEKVDFEFVYKGQSKVIQGIKLSKNGFSFSGSKIDRQFSYSKIDFQFNQNMKQHRNQSFSSLDKSIGISEMIPVQQYDDFQADFPNILSTGKQHEDDLNLKKKKKKKPDFGISF
jgi:hypothetical protein